MPSYTFTVRGIPAPQGSKRPVRLGNGRVGMVESSKAVAPWRERVCAEAQHVILAPISRPVILRLEFHVTRPKNHYGTGRNAQVVREAAPAYPDGKPDLDKLARSTMDGLTAAGAWKDDAQVVTLTAVKRYGELPGCTIHLEEA